ncbi:hypothetical protein SAMN04488690_1052 [Stenotrophomonas indicatrix]|jgi:hypothetical protein|uniref:Uncharacterized protein n=1 Tax=Stenotrophomonas indicatrix TaxID=2045451 RepID=A0A1W1GVH8_9GAMM|nr:hypothetical protein SAMN04488690_1052 [Stenotrophomonas indicatrix]
MHQGYALLGADGLERCFFLSGPACGCQLGACLGDEGGFLGALDGGTVTPVELPQNDASAADGHGHGGPKEGEGKKGSVMPESP